MISGSAVSSSHVRVSTFTFSDTRTKDDDEGGRLLGELLVAAGFTVVAHAVVREEPSAMTDAVVRAVEAQRSDAIVTTGGTGVSPRDRTIEALAPLFDKTLEGFGEAFRRLSWDDVGPRAILSRATAGIVQSRVVIALPGSPAAIRLAVASIIAPTLAHAVALASGRGGHHGKHGAGAP